MALNIMKMTLKVMKMALKVMKMTLNIMKIMCPGPGGQIEFYQRSVNHLCVLFRVFKENLLEIFLIECSKIRVLPNTDYTGYTADGYPANIFAGYPAK